MNEWGVVGVIIALLSLVAGVTAPVIKLNTSITKLTVTMDNLTTAQTTETKNNHDAHVRLWNHNEEQDEKINAHDKRISVLEERKNND